MQHPFDTLALKNGASLVFTPCPGTKGVELSTSVEQLKAAGAQAIITLMYDSEMADNDAVILPQACKESGLHWFQLPISDEDAPNEDFAQALTAHLADILALLNNKGTVAVHCKGGSGRTGLVIGLLMYQLGYSKAEIVEQVQAIRAKALTHPVQLAFFNSFELIKI